MRSMRLKSGALAAVLTLTMVLSLGVSACGAKQTVVPNLTGLNQSQANAAIVKAGLVAGSVTQQYSNETSAGIVLSQDPPAGTRIDEHLAVAYVVSKGVAPPPQVSVPSVGGMDEKAATRAMQAAGLAMVPYDEYNSQTAKGKAFGQIPAANEHVNTGVTVFVGFSLGAQPTDQVVPNLVGLTRSTAIARLEKGGFKTSVKLADLIGVNTGLVVAQSPQSGESAGPESHVIIMVDSGSPTAKVPDASGKQQEAAVTAVTNAALVPSVYHSVSTSVPRGRVMGQLPAPGNQQPNGSEVAVVISGGKATSTTSATPNVVRMSRTQAGRVIKAAGFRVHVVEAYDSTVPEGLVIGQVPAGGKNVDPGQDMVISVSTGPISKLAATVPKVTGKSQASAQSAMRKVGLRSRISHLYSSVVAEGKVMGQLPKAGAKLLKDTYTSIVMSLGKPAPLDVSVPNVTGKPTADALAVLQAAEFDPIQSLVFTEAAPSGTIYEQYPKAGTKVKEGSRVVIVAAQ